MPRTLLLWAVSTLLVIAAACGGSSEKPITAEGVSARVIVTEVQVSADDKRVVSITVLTDDGEEIAMSLGNEIELTIWDPSHLLSHAGLGKALGLKIQVTYVRTNSAVIATRLSE